MYIMLSYTLYITIVQLYRQYRREEHALIVSICELVQWTSMVCRAHYTESSKDYYGWTTHN